MSSRTPICRRCKCMGRSHAHGRQSRQICRGFKSLNLGAPTRHATKLDSAPSATPVGMALPNIPDALSKGTISGCVIP